MARVSIPITEISEAGVTPPAATAADAPNDHQLDWNDGRVYLEVVSSSGSTTTVTINTPKTVGGRAVADNAVSIPASGTKLIGPFPADVYNDANGFVQIDITATALAFRAYHLPQPQM